MITKTQAQAVKEKLEKQFPALSYGLGKDGQDWTVEVRAREAIPASLPCQLDGVTIRYTETGGIRPMK